MSKETLVLLYGGRSAERDVSVLSAESVMRAINYDNFLVKTYFITQAGDFIKTQEFDSQPSETDKLMTNDTIIASQKLSQVIFMRKKQLFFLFFMGLWERMVLFRAFLKF